MQPSTIYATTEQSSRKTTYTSPSHSPANPGLPLKNRRFFRARRSGGTGERGSQRRRRELTIALTNIRKNRTIKPQNHIHLTTPQPCEPRPPPEKSQIFQGKEEQGSGMKNREIQKGFPGFEWSGLCSDVANHSRNDKMHTPLPLSNYLRGGCAKRWDALINQGKSQCHEVLISWEVRSYAYIMLQTLR